MKINDVIYGDFEIDEPVLIDLILSKPLQRLKRLEQYGIPKELYLFPGYSRYDHSIGVMLLLRKLGASVEEQVAGLIHDISHTAFSHVIDFVFGSQVEEDYQDKIHSQIIRNSIVLEILKKYRVNVEKVINPKNFQLLEQEIPNLCVDRVDYALREFYLWADPENVQPLVESLIVYNGKLVFDSQKAAEIFARDFLKLQKEHWGHTDTVLRYYLLAKAVKLGLNEKVIHENDLNKDDNYVINKLGLSENHEIQRILKALSGKLIYNVNDKDSTIQLKKKFRYVDPEFVDGKILLRLSLVDEKFKTFIKEQKEINEKGVNIEKIEY